MARIRTIKPEFFTSLTVASLPVEARLTFIGLWTHVDDEGRCVDDARLIKAAVWPLDDRLSSDVELDLKTLSESSLILRYKVSERSYLAVRSWGEHQRINRATPSKLPPPPNPTDQAEHPARDAPDQAEPALTDGSVSTHAPVTEGSPLERKGKEQGKEQGKEHRTGASARRTTAQIDALFDQFWAVYPRREAKGAARKAFEKAIARADPDAITAGAARYRDRPGREAQYTAHPATWLNADRWTDEPTAQQTRPTNGRATGANRHVDARDDNPFRNGANATYASQTGAA